MMEYQLASGNNLKDTFDEKTVKTVSMDETTHVFYSCHVNKKLSIETISYSRGFLV
jgi:hypothetical protein